MSWKELWRLNEHNAPELQSCRQTLQYQFSIMGEGYAILHISLVVLVLNCSFCAPNPSFTSHCRLHIQRHTFQSLHKQESSKSKRIMN